MSLESVLMGTTLFEPVSTNKSGETEICVGRILDQKIWIGYIKVLLLVEKDAVEKGFLSDTVLNIAKIYYSNDMGGIAFLWRISCSDSGWLQRNAPELPKADWAKKFQNEKPYTNGLPDRIPLVGHGSEVRYPHPSDDSAISDMVP